MPSAPWGLPWRGGEDLVALLDVGEAVVEEREDVRRDLLAQAVAGAEILVDPDLHGSVPPWLVPVVRAWRQRSIGPGKPGQCRLNSAVAGHRPGGAVYGRPRAGHRPSNAGGGPRRRVEDSETSRRAEPAAGPRGGDPRPAPAPAGRAQAGPHARGAAARDQGPARPGGRRRTRSSPTRCGRRASTSPPSATRSTSSPARRRPTAPTSARNDDGTVDVYCVRPQDARHPAPRPRGRGARARRRGRAQRVAQRRAGPLAASSPARS